ncbi:non-structural polyprotein [Calicivirus isolate Allston 2008/US]|nr:non-structural polyprotein [Calicivirus isolate Allston 2008/US]
MAFAITHSSSTAHKPTLCSVALRLQSTDDTDIALWHQTTGTHIRFPNWKCARAFCRFVTDAYDMTPYKESARFVSQQLTRLSNYLSTQTGIWTSVTNSACVPDNSVSGTSMEFGSMAELTKALTTGFTFSVADANLGLINGLSTGLNKDDLTSPTLTNASDNNDTLTSEALTTEFNAEACPSCALYDKCPNCTAELINDDGTSQAPGDIPHWTHHKIASGIVNILSQDMTSMEDDDFANIAAHVKKALGTNSHPANNDMSKDQLNWLLNIAEASLIRKSDRTALPMNAARIAARRGWREKLFNEPADKLYSTLRKSKDSFQKSAIWSIIFEKAANAKHYSEIVFQEVVKLIKEECNPSNNFYFKVMAQSFLDHFRMLVIDNPDPVANLPKFILKLKPLNLKMIIENHENTAEGWIVTLTAVAELYGWLEFAIDLVPKIVSELYDLLTSATQKCYSMVRELLTNLNILKAESLDLTNPFWYALAALLSYFITGFLPNNAKCSAIKQTLNGATTLVAGITAIQKLAAMFSAWSNESVVDDLSTKVIGLTEVDNPTVTQDIDAVTNLQIMAEQVKDQIKLKTLDPTFQPYLPVLRNLMSTAESVISHCAKRKALATQRVAPVCIILTGPAGCGKTTLAYAIASRLSSQKPSVLNLNIDHHDAYTGNEVCIIDEFDSNPDSNFTEFVVEMVNTNPMLLNCDLIENKGKVFSSKYVIMTSNNETPVKPTSTRAPPFYRRVRIIDVTNPGVMNFKYANPGEEVPAYLYTYDFAHLQMSMRGFGAFSKTRVIDPEGRKACGLEARPGERVQVDDIVRYMQRVHRENQMAFKAEDKKRKTPRFAFVTQREHVDTVYKILAAAKTTYNGYYSLTKDSFDVNEGHNIGSSVFVVGDDMAIPPDCKIFRCNHLAMFRHPELAHIEGDNFRAALGVTMSDQDVTLMFYHIRGKHIQDEVRLDELPANHHIVTVHSVYDMAWALNRHLSLTGKWQALKAVYDLYMTPDILPAALRHWMDQTSFSSEHVVTQFIVPGGTIILETCNGARIWATSKRLIRAGGISHNNGPEGGFRFGSIAPRDIPWSEILREFLNLVSLIWSRIKGATIVLTALLLYMKRYKPRSEAKGKTKGGRGAIRHGGKGVVLADDEYDEWRDFKMDKRMDISVDEFLMLKHRAALGSDDRDSIQFRSWWSARQMRQDTGLDHEDVTVIGKGKVSHEVHRTEIMKAPKRPKKNGSYAWGEDMLAEGDGKVCNHVNAIMPVTGMCNEHIGHAVHIGHGVCISLKHVLKTGSYVFGQKPLNVTFNGELAYFQINTYPSSAAPVGYDSKPVRDPWGRPVSTEWKHEVYNTSAGKMCGSIAWTATKTQPGDCGLPYVDDRGRIVGLHAGSGGDASPGRKIIIPVVKVKMNSNGVFAKAFWQEDRRTIKYKGLTVQETGEMRSIVKGTRLHVSPAHVDDYHECSHQPANLGAEDPRNPISLTNIVVNNLQPYKEPTPGPPENILVRAKKMLIAQLEPYIPKSETHLSMIEAFKKLNKDTSCGPYIGGRKKDHIDEETGLPDKLLMNHLADRWQLAEQGLAIPHEYALGLKDELRPVDKIAVAKRRLIWGCDVAVATVAAAAFKDVSDAIMSMHEFGFIQVGINMDGRAVETLYDRLYRKGMHRYCVDYSKWDSTQPPNVTTHSLDILRHFTDKSPIVDSAVATLSSPPIAVFGGVSFKTSGGLPSGMPLTSILNSLNHCLLVGCALIQSIEEKGVDVNWNIYDYMDMFTYGDDGVYIVPNFYDSVMPNVFNCLSSYGLKPTRTDKSSAPITEVPEDENVEFLKRTFVKTPNGIRALLDRNSLLRQFYYIKGKNSMNWTEPPKEIDTSSRSAQLWNVMLYASQHGEMFFEKCRQMLMRAIDHEGLVIEPITYDAALHKYNCYFNGVNDCEVQMLSSDAPNAHEIVFEN